MEAIHLSETSAAACAKALTFTWISCFGVHERSLLIVGCNLLPIFGFNYSKCLTFRTSKLQLITLSRTVQSFDCTAASKTRFTHVPPQQHGPRSYPLCSLDSEHNRGKTLVFPQLRQFLVHKLSCQINFCKMTNFQLTPLSKNFPKPCMFLLLLFLGTILAPICLASCQLSYSPPSSSGSVEAAWFHHFSCSTTAPTQSCATAPAPSPSEPGCMMRWSQACTAADATHGSPRRHGRLPGSHPGGPAATKRVSFSDPLVSSPSFPLPPRDGPGIVFLPGEEVFACPGPAAPSQVPQTQVPSMGTAK
jgi:hypothetical protein